MAVPERRPAYGIDLPATVIAEAAMAVFLVFLGLFLTAGTGRPVWGLPAWLAAGALAFSVSMHLRSSSVGKPALVRAELDRLGLTGSEHAVDLGCGRGLGLVELARRLPDGVVDGVDVWRGRDQSGNQRAATELNLRVTGVSDRVTVHDADLRCLPLADDSCDLALAVLSLRSLPSRADRQRAVAEAARVLRPGGRLVAIDGSAARDVADHLDELGFEITRRAATGPALWPPGTVVVARLAHEAPGRSSGD